MRKEERNKCWTARDAYFDCLKEKGLWLHGLNLTEHKDIVNIDPSRLPVKLETDKSLTKEEKNSLFTCRKVYEMFATSCPPSWVGLMITMTGVVV
jgi:cytochrome c oxidase assembly factor 6